mmetsp:Transcript_20411/g.35088  ORF Transcript_20411/g.35088 Transcript_20411/m.35088 type:complete len:434 (-) Transcript_20411:81-1382(-)
MAKLEDSLKMTKLIENTEEKQAVVVEATAKLTQLPSLDETTLKMAKMTSTEFSEVAKMNSINAAKITKMSTIDAAKMSKMSSIDTTAKMAKLTKTGKNEDMGASSAVPMSDDAGPVELICTTATAKDKILAWMSNQTWFQDKHNPLSNIRSVSLDQDQTVPSALFDFRAFFGHLKTEQYAHSVIYRRLMQSTQTLLAQYFSAAPIEGLLCLSDEQLSGKGRGSNKWESPLGCLLYSFKCREPDAMKLPFLQYIVSLALVHGIKTLPSAQDIDIRIKWPNDIYGDGMKIGGILCQSAYSEGAYDVVVGIGLNVTNDKPTTCLSALVDKVCPGAGAAVTRERVLAAFFTALEPKMRAFTSEGFQQLVPEYLKHWLHTDQEVIVGTGDEATPVVIKGLTDAGFLLAVGKDGARFELHPDGNSLDFFAGLIKKKLAT